MEYKKGDILNKRYKIIENIGFGSTAIVYSAKDLETDKEIALKVSKVDASVSNNDKRFAQEAELLLKLDNENIVKAYEVFDDEYGAKVIAMEYLKGMELNEALQTKVTLKNEVAVKYILQIINALKDLHSLGTMHRDLKPQNVFIAAGDTVKLMDFGIAQVSEDQNFTRVGSVIGTVAYMAPELLTQKTKANITTEIYALGIMLYKMLAGSVPFTGQGDRAIATNVLKGGAPKLHETYPQRIDKPLSDIVDKMIAHDYLDRFQSLEELEEILKAYLDGTLKVEEPAKKKMGLFRRKKEI